MVTLRTVLVVAAATMPTLATAQSACRAITRQLATLGPRARLGELTAPGRSDRDVISDASVCSVAPNVITSPSWTLSAIGGQTLRIVLQPTIVQGAFLGSVADPRNDGPAWYGRGSNFFVRTGVSLDLPWFHVVAAPQLWHAQNKPFDVFPSTDASRNSFASPWYALPFSVDLPSRFGVKPLTQIDVGESAVWGSVGPVDAGVTASTQRWGPGERGTLVIGPDAPGIPRVFVRTSRPVQTPIGSFSGEVFAGTLTESRYFDTADTNNLRSITAWNVAWSPGDSSTFIVGIAHGSQRLGTRFGGQRSAQPVRGSANQINEVYAQFRDPRTGIRAWGELGRAGALPTDQNFVRVPYQGIVYLLGAERALPSRHGTLLLSFELANLEQPTDIRGGVRQDLYTSSSIPQGWSQRGQLLGYSTGPGSEAQWVATDWIASWWSFGFFGDRVRWNEDALIRQNLANPVRHDVTIRGGVRGGAVVRGTEIAIEAAIGHRINYLFQNGVFIPGYRTVDLSVPSLRFSITPAINVR
jgi:hypothetical protein